MRVLTVVLSPAASLALGLAAGPVSAGRVGIEDVRTMAFDCSVGRLKEIELDGGVWEVEGKTRYVSGNEIEMEVDAWRGRIAR